MLPITPRCAGLLLIVCAAVQGATVDDAEREQDAKHEAVVLVEDFVLLLDKNSALSGDCRNDTTCGDFEVCSQDYGACECMPGYHWELALSRKQQTCVQCPGVSHGCADDCCYPANETRCYNGYCQCRYDVAECSMQTVDQFKLATQIALVSAIILVIACLLVILWRTCRKQRGQRQRRRMPRRSDASEASLTSVQLRVVERLRNRPPGYHDRSHIRIEKPPSYEETIGQPLRYPALALDPTLCPSEAACPAYDQLEAAEGPVAAINLQVLAGEADAPSGGVDNSAFVEDDDDRDSKQVTSPELHM